MKKQLSTMKALILSLIHTIVLSLSLTSCIEPPLKLPAQEVLVDLPLVITDIEVVWNLDVDWHYNWYYGWDEQDKKLFGAIEYPEPTNFEVRRYFQGSQPRGPHTNVDGFTIFGNRFRKAYQFGYYDMLIYSNIDSEDGTQVVEINEDNLDETVATTSVSRGLSRLYSSVSDTDDGARSMVTGVYNQPEIFYSAYPRDIYISRFKEDYDYFDEVEKCYVKHINCTLNPLVYLYLVQVIFINNDGKVVGGSGNAAMTAFSSSTNVNTGHTYDDPVIVYFNTRYKPHLDYKGTDCDIMGGIFTTYGLCDMEPYTRAPSHIYEGTRVDLPNYLLVDIKYRNGTEETLQLNVTEQCLNQAHGGIITVVIDCNDLKMPDGPDSGDGSLFVPTVEDYDEIVYDIPM